MDGHKSLTCDIVTVEIRLNKQVCVYILACYKDEVIRIVDVDRAQKVDTHVCTLKGKWIAFLLCDGCLPWCHVTLL